jgi:restriction endonuclease S subunit
VVQANRIDTDYFESRHDVLISHLAQYGAQPLHKFVHLRQEHFFPQKNVLFEYIEISDIDLSNGLCSSKQLLGENAPDRAQQIVHVGDLITSTVRPLRGGTALIRPNQDRSVCSSGFVVLQPQKILAEYLLVYLRLHIIRELINRDNRASMYPAVTVQDILQIPVVLFSGIEAEIQAKVSQSHQAFFDAARLLESAKERVEKMIEAGVAHG